MAEGKQRGIRPACAARALSLCALAVTVFPAFAQQPTMAPAQMRAALEATAHQWIAFRNWQGRQLVYFTHLVAWKCAIDEIRYVVNGRGLSERFPLPACNPQDPFRVDAEKDTIFLSFAPGEVSEISIRLVYGDGTESEVRRFAPCERAGDSACAVALK
jgi:hypothetical protein